jgi:hypothetical protein
MKRYSDTTQGPHRMRSITIAAIVAAALGAALAGHAPAAASTSTAAAASAPAGVGAWRSWGGTTIRALDRAPARSATASASSSAPTGIPGRDVWLSNENKTTQWAYVAAIGPIRTSPSPQAKVVTKLHWNTEDGFPEIYELLREHWDLLGHAWVQLRIPMRPNGRTGWVRREDLGSFHVTHTLVTVNRTRLRMYFSLKGRVIWSAPVGVGKPSTPTPAGHFWIRERFKISDPSSGYWPYAFGTSDYSTLSDWPGGGVVGIHGPYYDNAGIPGYISHGCIRLHPRDDFWLAKHIQLGTPLHVI